MSLENFKNIGEHIEINNPKEREKVLFEKIEQISLVYADKKFQETRKDNPGYKLSEAIKDFTPMENIILKPVFHLEGFELSKYKEKKDLFLNDFYKQIDSLYEADGFDADKILNLVDSKKDSVKEYLEVGNLKEVEHGKKEIDLKILNYNKITNIEKDAEEKYKDLEKLGFSKFDHFIEIHVEDFYNTGEKNLGSDLIKNDLARVAEYIIDKEPQTAAVVGRSWLLDTPLADRLGFKKIENDKNEKQNDFSIWLQFIDKNGQIDQKRFNEFVQTGELPYESTKAYMPIEEFLKRYLPENRRGKIVLKEVSKDKIDFWSEMQEKALSLKVDWDDLLRNNGDLNGFVQNNKALNVLFGFLAPEDEDEYFSFLTTMYNSNIPWSNFFEHKNEGIKKIDDKINKAMKDDLYRDKEFFVE